MKQVMIFLTLIIVGILIFMPELQAKEESKNQIKQEKLIFDFSKAEDIENWRVVNDGVMGGVSKSEIALSESNSSIFKGTVSLQNYGGFASIRTISRSYELEGYSGVLLRLKGDGKKYQFRLRTNDRFDGVSYRYQFQTELNEWMIIELPFHEFVPVFRGRILEGIEPVIPKEIQQFGFLIANNRSEKFQLEIAWIKAYR